jgi:hypothetical protein
LPFPEYVAVTGYPPAGKVADVVQEVAGRVAVHNVVDPEVKVTVPVAAPGTPETDRVTAVPYAAEAGVAEAVMVYAEVAVIKKEVEAVAPVKLTSPG